MLDPRLLLASSTLTVSPLTTALCDGGSRWLASTVDPHLASRLSICIHTLSRLPNRWLVFKGAIDTSSLFPSSAFPPVSSGTTTSSHCPPHPSATLTVHTHTVIHLAHRTTMGAVASCLNSIVNAIVGAITAVFSAIAGVLSTIVRAIGTALTATFNCIADVICCRCGSRGGRRSKV